VPLWVPRYALESLLAVATHNRAADDGASDGVRSIVVPSGNENQKQERGEYNQMNKTDRFNKCDYWTIHDEHPTPKKSDVYIAFLALLEAKRALVLDNSCYRTQAAALERKVVSGNEIIDHPASSHDDVVNAVAGVLVYATHELRVQKIPMVGVSWFSKQTGWVEPGRAAQIDTSVPGGPSYRAQPTMQEMRAPDHTTDGRWRQYTAPYDRWSNRG
jgi:hypothetical protein